MRCIVHVRHDERGAAGCVYDRCSPEGDRGLLLLPTLWLLTRCKEELEVIDEREGEQAQVNEVAALLVALLCGSRVGVREHLIHTTCPRSALLRRARLLASWLTRLPWLAHRTCLRFARGRLRSHMGTSESV